jgi:hypothetical protein
MALPALLGGGSQAGIVPTPPRGENAPRRVIRACTSCTAKTVHRTYAHMIPGAGERGGKAMVQFFRRSAPDVAAEGAQ